MYAKMHTMGPFIWIFVVLLTVDCVNGIKWDSFSVQTTYAWAHDVNREVTQDDLYTIIQPGKTCKAIHVNGVYRHGARNPTKTDIADIDTLIKTLQDNKKIGRFPFIDTWRNPFELETESDLVDEGNNEMSGLGNRMKVDLESLLKHNAANLEFTTSNTSRTKDSSTLLKNALGSDRPVTVDDAIIRFYKGCKNYEEKIINNPDNFKEFTKFNLGAKFLEVSDSLKANLGLNASLSSLDIYNIYFLCAFEKYIYNRTDWCQLMSNSEREVLEYGQDIKKWYEYSYGHPLNTKLACPLVSDMFLTMDAAMNDDWKYTSTGVTDYSGNNIDNSGYLAGKFQNGHLGFIIRLYTIMGLFKDSSPLLANNMDKMSNRKFKTSHIIPYAGNLVFIVYACDSTVNVDSTDAVLRDREYYIKLLVNEAPVTIPGCGSDTCLYTTVRDKFKDHIDNCNIRALCEDDDPTDNGVVNRAGLIMPIMILSFYFMF